MTSMKFVLVLFLFVKAVNTTCISQNTVYSLNAARKPLVNIEKYIGKCDHDSALKAPMASIGSCLEKLKKDFDIVNHVFHSE